jgi:hypothetical protein
MLLVEPGLITLPLSETINQYRISQGLPAIPVSRSLTTVAERHIEDLEKNSPHGGVCNLHSWSSHGTWTACCYTADHAQAQCMWREPREITRGQYTGNGFAIAVGPGTNLTTVAALNAWRSSEPHHNVILNRATWSDNTWRVIGAAMSSRYAVVWFGELVDPAGTF